MISVLYINNEGGGFPAKEPVNDGTTFGEFVSARISDTTRYRIRLNGGVAEHETVLNDGDRITVTPIKVDGGC